MDDERKNLKSEQNECLTHAHPLPPGEIGSYSVDADPHLEMDIANYVEIEAPDENVEHVEKIKREVVLGDIYDIWEVITDKDRWWVITNLTNLYSQKHFPSLDYTLSFHIDLMMRLRSRNDSVDGDEPSPFDEVIRRGEQASAKHDNAIEVEDYQAVGMLLRESLVSLISAMRRRIDISVDIDRPQDSNFIGWTEVFANQICVGRENKDLRKHLKNIAKETWQLVNWLTHARHANKTASSIAIHSCQTVIGHFIQIIQRERTDKTDECPVCKSRDVRTHFDISIQPDGDYYMSCGVCDWTNHPETNEQ